MHNDKAHQKAAKGSSGVVGESHIWDGPLSQEGRLHGQGSSSGITGMQGGKSPTMYRSGPITQLAKGK